MSFAPGLGSLSSHDNDRDKNVAILNIYNNTKLYRKILKIMPGAYIFQKSFLRGIFLERLIFGWAYLG